MSVTIKLMVFSGRENPQWELTPDQVGVLRDKLNSLRGTTMERPTGMLGGLGYQGFSLSAEREIDLEQRVFVHANIVDLGPQSVALRDASNNLEAWLLDTAGSAVEPEVRSYVQSQFESPPLYAGGSAQRSPRARALEVPRFEPSIWNNDPSVLVHNNCYNYANNKITNTFAQPGRGTGAEAAFPPTGPGVTRAAISDGLEPLANPEGWQSTPTDGHWVALVISSVIRDYHWYRLDDFNARWSHKPGETKAREVDQSAAQISDPRTCDRRPYAEFAGFFHTYPGRITIR